MKITRVETIRIDEFPQLLWVRVHTDAGLIGLGETFFFPTAVESYIHDNVAHELLGRDPLAIDAISRDMVTYVGFRSTGAESRASSAIDLALWDLFGKATGQPVVQLLGGWTRNEIRTYNTCAGSSYMRRSQTQSTRNWGIDANANQNKVTGFDDLNDFLHRADELAESLLSEGITALKIWPFDLAAEANHGHHISSAELRAALAPFEKIRKRVGDRMDIMVEFHSLWSLLPAMKIAQALAPFGTYWHEDPIKMNSLSSLKRYAEVSPAPICASETLGSRWAFRDLLETGAAGIIMLDLGWCGGLSEARKIASMAEAWHLPVAPHDCTGPVVFAASVHLSLNAPNALVQESVRAFYNGWYKEVAAGLPQVTNGYVTISKSPGLGCELLPDIDQRFTVLPDLGSIMPAPVRDLHRWRMAILLGIGVLVNYIDRVNISVSFDALHSDFGLSTVGFGYLLGAFNWTYALLQLPVGVLLDRFGVRKIGILGALLWSLASFGAAISPGVGVLFAMRLLLGLGEAPTFPANAKAIDQWFPRSERGLPTAIFDAAAKFGPAVGVPLVGIVLIHFGWRWSFAASGALSFLYFGAFVLFYQDNPSASHADSHPGVTRNGAPLTYLLRQGKVIGLVTGFFGYNYCFYLLLFWLPTYFSTLHLDPIHSAFYSAVPWLFATLTDLWIGGLLVDHLIRRGFDQTKVRLSTLIGGTLGGLCIAGAILTQSSIVAVVWLSLSLGGLSAAAPVGWSLPALIAPRGSVGKVSSILNTGNQLSGIVAPVVTGYILAWTHSFAAAFGVAACLLVAGVFAYLYLLRSIEPVPEPPVYAPARHGGTTWH